jgi:iron complex transport system permease protein
MTSGRAAATPLPAETAPDRRRFRGWAVLLGVVLLASMAASLCFGAVTLTPLQLWTALWSPADLDPTQRIILWDLRLPRTLLAVLVGGGLAAAGTAFQALFRNALADPYVVGASSGAALGATLVLTMGWSTGFAGLGPLPVAAFLGALLAVAAALLLAESGGGSASIASLLLAGTALGAMLSAAVSFLLLWRDQPWFQVFNWLLGSFSGRSWAHVTVSWPYFAVSFVSLWFMARPLDALTLGEETAASLGLPVRRVRIGVIAAATLAAGVAVAISGIIGFVGLIAPHLARLLFGAGHRRLLVASALLGSILLVWADIGARSVLAPVEVPVGILTAALGGPFFLFILRRRGGRLS